MAHYAHEVMSLVHVLAIECDARSLDEFPSLSVLMNSCSYNSMCFKISGAI